MAILHFQNIQDTALKKKILLFFRRQKTCKSTSTLYKPQHSVINISSDKDPGCMKALQYWKTELKIF